MSAPYVIVGGTKGIGLAIAQTLSQEGHDLIIISRKSPEQELPRSSYQIWDAASGEAPVLNLSEVAGVVYCPGTIRLKPFHRLTASEILEDLQINTLGAVQMLQILHKPLIAHGSASVVLFSTVATSQGMPFHASIAMAKGAVEGLAISLAAEWAPHVRVNTISPSLTATPLSEKLLNTPEKTVAADKRHPLGRVGQASDLAQLACFLLSEKSQWITGQNFGVDGGMSTLRAI
jgi:3-oxoacyl-[acyl-carrier protein] reductase